MFATEICCTCGSRRAWTCSAVDRAMDMPVTGPQFCIHANEMTYTELQQCLGEEETQKIAQKRGESSTYQEDSKWGHLTEKGGHKCTPGVTCSDEAWSSMVNAKLTGLQCATVSQLCHTYNAVAFSDPEKRQACIEAVSEGMCATSELATPAGRLHSCTSNLIANQDACATLQQDCRSFADIQDQLAALGEKDTEKRQQLEQAQETHASALQAHGCSLGYCMPADKSEAEMAQVCLGADSVRCGQDGPCRWEQGQCVFSPEAAYHCNRFTEEAECNRHNCAWDPRMCKARPANSNTCPDKKREQCISPHCQWQEVDNVIPTAANLTASAIDCARNAGAIGDKVPDNAALGTSEPTGTHPSQAPAAPTEEGACYLDPTKEEAYNAEVGQNAGSLQAQVCQTYTQPAMCR